MGYVQNMAIPFMLILFTINGFMLFMSYLPADQKMTRTMDYGLSEADKISLLTDINGFAGDANTVKTGMSNIGVQGTTTEKTDLGMVAGALIGGAGCLILTGGSPAAGIACAIGGGLVGVFMKYVVYLVFGYFFWIDFLFLPLTSSSLGAAFTALALGIKGFFAIIQTVAMLNILLPIFASGRRI